MQPSISVVPAMFFAVHRFYLDEFSPDWDTQDNWETMVVRLSPAVAAMPEDVRETYALGAIVRGVKDFANGCRHGLEEYSVGESSPNSVDIYRVGSDGMVYQISKQWYLNFASQRVPFDELYGRPMEDLRVGDSLRLAWESEKQKISK
jgi:hypothetical protein